MTIRTTPPPPPSPPPPPPPPPSPPPTPTKPLPSTNLMVYFFYRENHVCAARFFSSVKRAPAGAHEAPGAQTSLCGAKIEKNIFFFQLKRVPAGTLNVKRAPAGAHEAPGSHLQKYYIYFFPTGEGPSWGPEGLS